MKESEEGRDNQGTDVRTGTGDEDVTSELFQSFQ
jgi:hypothetical protein